MTRRGLARVLGGWIVAAFGVAKGLQGKSQRLTFAYHATARTGEWLNDPNGLVYSQGRYLLFAQHSKASPGGADVGWARFVSDDLLRWRWDGIAIAPDSSGAAYSGSVVRTAQGLAAYFTRHDPRAKLQTQHKTINTHWVAFSQSLGPAGQNCRDPFVFRCAASGEWRMIVAEPCDWVHWRQTLRSKLSVWGSRDQASWYPIGTIGPWSRQGVMWEVPVLIPFGDCHVLIVSLVDRRRNRADCEVRYWVGHFDGGSFERGPDCPEEGHSLDFGPDFYAAIVNLEAGWTSADRVIVAWASNWNDAPGRTLANGSRGGAITLPRIVQLRQGRLRQKPISGADKLAYGRGAFGNSLAVGDIVIHADRRGDRISVEATNWKREGHAAWDGDISHYTLFRDQGLCELFIQPEGLSITWMEKLP